METVSCEDFAGGDHAPRVRHGVAAQERHGLGGDIRAFCA